MEQPQQRLAFISPEDYGKIENLEFNRDVDKKHVAELQALLGKYGFLTTITVREVEGKFKVIDGQHRCQAGMNLNLHIPVIIADQLPIAQIPRAISHMNTTSNLWRLKDFFNLYCSMGETQYVWLQKFMKSHSLSLTTCLYLWSSDPLKQMTEGKRDWRTFKAGTWKPLEEFRSNVDDIIFTLHDLKAMLFHDHHKTNVSLNDALVRIILHPKFKKEQMIANLDHVSAYQIEDHENMPNHFDNLASIYNRSSTGRLTFHYQIAVNGQVATSEREASKIREKYFDIDQFAEISPYHTSTVMKVHKHQPNNGVADVVRGRRKYWKISTAMKWANAQHAKIASEK